MRWDDVPYGKLRVGSVFTDRHNTAPFVKIDEDHAIGLGGTIGVQAYLYRVGTYPTMETYQNQLTTEIAAVQLELVRQGYVSTHSAPTLADELLEVVR